MCARGYFRKEKVGDSKISGYVWTGPIRDNLITIRDHIHPNHWKHWTIKMSNLSLATVTCKLSEALYFDFLFCPK